MCARCHCLCVDPVYGCIFALIFLRYLPFPCSSCLISRSLWVYSWSLFTVYCFILQVLLVTFCAFSCLLCYFSHTRYCLDCVCLCLYYLSLCCLCLVCVFFFTFLTFGLLFFLVGSCWTFVNGLASFSIKAPFLHWQSISVLFALVFVWLAFSTQKIGTSIEVAQQGNGVPSRATSRKTDSLNCHLSYKQDLLPDPKVQRNNPLFFQGKP